MPCEPTACDSPNADHMTSSHAEQPSPREQRRAMGLKLKAARQTAGLSQRELAHKIGYTRSGVSSAESGGYASRRFYECCDELLDTGGILAAQYDAMADERSRGMQVSEEFGEPRMKVVVGYTRGAWHIEVHLPEHN
jgi:DNA-binding XRE family transcriptional regulator